MSGETPARTVLLYGWDLKGFPKPLLKSWKLLNKLDDKYPRRLIHVGVAVFQKFYHFNKKGMHIDYQIASKKCNLPPENATTTRTHEEFEEWLGSVEIRNRFSYDNYHPVDNNCIDFALAACKFLKVEVPEGLHTTLNDWLKGQNAVYIFFKAVSFRRFFGVSERTYVDSVDGRGEETDAIDEEELIGWERISVD